MLSMISDHPLETFQFRQQQMGEISEGGQFSVQEFRSNAISRIGSTRNHSASQRIVGTTWRNEWNSQFNR